MPPHRYPVRVYFEDTDAGGVVYHANYLRFAERARTEALREAGLPHQTMMEEHGAILVVRRAVLDFLQPARLDDLLTVETAPLSAQGATILLRQRVLREEAPLAELQVTLACIDRASLRPRRIPEPWRQLLGKVPPAITATE